MKPEDVMRLAKSAGFFDGYFVIHKSLEDIKPIDEMLIQFATAIRNATLEEAAALCDKEFEESIEQSDASWCAEKIRAMKGKE